MHRSCAKNGMGTTSQMKRRQMWKEREKRLPRSRLLTLLVCLAGCRSLGVLPVASITTTDALVESTHTPLPVTPEEETSAASSPDLSEAETKDPQRLEIIKQIRKVNQDGSYTVGYEAEDGTFKIESRDVLGNIKGTYGYIDVNGDIKRVSYGGSGQQQPVGTTPGTPPSTTEEDVVHIPPRYNRSQMIHHHHHQQQQLLVPTTRRPPNYQPPAQQHHHQHLHHNPQHASTLRPSVIQTIPRKRTSYSTSTTTTTTTTTSTTAAAAAGGGASSGTTAASSTMTTPMSMTTAKPTTEAAGHGHLAPSYGEPTTASTHSKPQSTLLIIRPTPLPYQAAKTAEQLARPDRLGEVGGKYGAPAIAPSKKPVRGNFLRRQLPTAAAPPAAVAESAEQYEAQQQQEQQQHHIVYGQAVADGELGSIYAKPGLYSTHPTPRIPAAVLAARQRAAHIQSVLQGQGQGAGGAAKERVYVKQPARPPPQLVYESSTEPTAEHGYVTDGPGAASVVQIPAANRAATVAASEVAESDVDERRPIFRPRPIEFRPRDASPRYRTPYGLPPPFGRSFTPLPPPTQELPYATAGRPEADDGDAEDAPQQFQPQQLNALLPYRQQRRLNSGGLPAADSGYGGQQQHSQQQHQQQQQQQQQQNSFPIPVPYGPGGYAPGGRFPAANPYYYDIPPERPLTARDFERILQLLIFRHQQLQHRYRGAGVGGYYGGYNAGYNPYNPYFPGPSPAPFGGGLYGGGYPQQQIPRPPLPFPYGSPYDGYQNPLYSPSSPSAAMRAGPPEGAPADPDAGYGQRRSGQFHPYQSAALDGSGAGSGSSGALRSPDYLPPDVREGLLYRMLMLAIQTAGATDVLPLAAPTGPSSSPALPPHLHHQQQQQQPLQGASSVPRPHTQPSQRAAQEGGAGASAASTALPMFSKKPVRSVQILGEE